MSPKTETGRAEVLDASRALPESASGGPAPSRSVRVRRGTQGGIETVAVPPGTAAVHAGLQHLRSEPTPESVDDWYVIEV